MSTRRGQDYQENAAVAAAIAAVATANDATAATNMMDCHAGDLFSGGGGEETAIEAVNEAINVAINDVGVFDTILSFETVGWNSNALIVNWLTKFDILNLLGIVNLYVSANILPQK